MDFDMNAWLDELGVSGDDRSLAVKLFEAPDRQNKLKGSVMRQSEFSRTMNELKDKEAGLQAKIDAAQAEVEAERGALTTWRTNADGQLTKAQKRAEDLENTLLATQQKIRKVAEDNGLDPDDVLKLDGVVIPKKEPVKEPVSGIDDEYKTAIERSFSAVARAPALLMKLNAEHRKLFGEDMPDPDAIVDEVLAAANKGQNLSLQGVWEKKYKVAEKRTELADADFKRRVAEAVEVGVREKIEAAALNGGAPDDLPGSPILAKFPPKNADGSKKPAHNGETAAEAATRSFNSGKHRKEAQAIARAALAG